MELTKDILLADRQHFQAQLASAQVALNYIAGLLAFVEKPQPEENSLPDVSCGTCVEEIPPLEGIEVRVLDDGSLVPADEPPALDDGEV